MWFGGVARIDCHGDDRLIKLDGVKLQSGKASAETTDSQIEGDMSSWKNFTGMKRTREEI